MKLSCIPICFFDEILQKRTMSLQDWFSMAKELGLEGVEMYISYLALWEKDYLMRLSEEVESFGLEVSMLTSYHNLGTSDERKRRRQIHIIKRDVDVAGMFKTKIVRVTAGVWPEDIGRSEALKNVAICLREALEYAEERGVVLALENHPEIGTKIGDFMEIIERVGSEKLRVNFDTSNPMVSGDNAVELANLVKERVVHVHASDRNENLEHQVIGEGIVDFKTIFKILKSAGFDGWISLEAGGTKGKEGIRKGMEFVRKTWGAV